MSDDSPWKPPAPGEPDPTERDARGGSAPEPAADPPSPWSRDAALDGSIPRIPPPEPVDSVPAPPQPVPPRTGDWDPPAAPTGAGATATSDLDAADRSTSVGPPASAEPKRRSAKVVAVATAVIVAVGVAGIFAVRGLTGETASGGATPEELGEELLDAIEGEDMLGVIDLMLPGERATLGEPLIDTVAELQRLDVLASDLDLANIAGLDVVLDQRAVGVESTNVSDIAHVTLGAAATVSLDGAEVPIGELITDHVPDDALTELRGSRVTETDQFEFELTAVEHDGRWYFSAWYSVAELARAEAGIADIPVEGVGAFGADSPEQAIDRWVAQAEALDVRGLIQSLDPYEAAALQRYAPLFLADIEDEVAQFEGLIEITDYSVRFEGSGSSRTALLDSMEIEFADEGVVVSMTYADGCTRMEWADEYGSEEMEVCGGDFALAEEMAGLAIPSGVEALGEAVTDAFADMAPIGAELRERDGKWYISPISTLSEAWLKALRSLDREELDRIIDAVPPAFEALTAEWFGSDGGPSILDEALGGLSDAGGVDDGWFEHDATDASDGDEQGGWTTVPDELANDGGAVTVPGEVPNDGGAVTVPGEVPNDGGGVTGSDDPGDLVGTFDPDPAEKCYEMVDVNEAIECFDDVIARGEAEAWIVPPVLRFPECGLAEFMWSGELYVATDEVFVATITAAQPCFDALVADGAIEEWELPYEVVDFDCFENRNWYATFDDEEYDARVTSCLGF